MTRFGEGSENTPRTVTDIADATSSTRATRNVLAVARSFLKRLTPRQFTRSIREYRRQVVESPAPASLSTVIRDFPAWIRYQDGSTISEGVPWITFAARRALNGIVGPQARVFEYGSGGSTVFFAEKCELLVSVEHDPVWHQMVDNEVQEFGNVELILMPPTSVIQDVRSRETRDYRSSDPDHEGMWFFDYVRTIERFPDGYFDVVMVDGRARVDAFIHGMNKVRDGGSIVLDDSERPNYEEAIQAARAWPRRRYVGPKPFVRHFTETSIWRKPASKR